MNKIAAALVKAQKSFAPALKTNTNPHFRSKYVGLDGCVEAVIDALNDNGIFLMQMNHEAADGVTVETVFIHESGETLSAGKLHVPASKLDAQGFGSALTYARRYSLMAACGIAPEDDDGNAAVRNPPKTVHKPTQSITPIAGALDALDPDEQEFLREQAGEVTAYVADGNFDKAKEITDSLDNEEKLGLWSLLDSKTRSALKKHNESLKQAA